MVDQLKLLRVLKLIGLLRSNGKRTIIQLAEQLGTKPRNVYRYIKLLEETGFIIDKNFDKKYFICEYDDLPLENLHFSLEESHLLNELLLTAANRHPLQDSIRQKLYVLSEASTIPDQIFKKRLHAYMKKLNQAINEQMQVRLLKYHSAHSNTVRDRLIEPISFTDNYQTLNAFDTVDKTNKIFKLERIGGVEITGIKFQHTQQHKSLPTDIFGLSGNGHIEVHLKLTLRAYSLLCEEYPLSIEFITSNEEEKYFQGHVHDLKGVGRFVMGLPEDVEILQPTELKEYVKNQYKKYIEGKLICL